MKADWFTKFISASCGIVKDCLIAFVSDDWKTIIPISKENYGLRSVHNRNTSNSALQYLPAGNGNSGDGQETGDPAEIVVPPLAPDT